MSISGGIGVSVHDPSLVGFIIPDLTILRYNDEDGKRNELACVFISYLKLQYLPPFADWFKSFYPVHKKSGAATFSISETAKAQPPGLEDRTFKFRGPRPFTLGSPICN